MLELARPDDREAVNALARQIHAMHAAWRPDIYEMVDELYPEDYYLDAVRRRELYVAKLNDIVVGYICLKMRDYDWPGMVPRKVMVVDAICVEETCRNQGIGQQMMLEVRALARAFRCTDLQLTVDPHNDHALNFYQKCGFTIKNIGMQRKV